MAALTTTHLPAIPLTRMTRCSGRAFSLLTPRVKELCLSPFFSSTIVSTHSSAAAACTAILLLFLLLLILERRLKLGIGRHPGCDICSTSLFFPPPNPPHERKLIRRVAHRWKPRRLKNVRRNHTEHKISEFEIQFWSIQSRDPSPDKASY